MKTAVYITAGAALLAAVYYFWKSKKGQGKNLLPERRKEMHHLTNIFSKAKQVAIGN